MSIRVGITGGIGTGKSFVSRIFKTLGVPFYDADKAAKRIMVTNPTVRKHLIDYFGKETYGENGDLNHAFLAQQVFQNDAKLKMLNSIVHPAVIKDGEDWAASQSSAYSLKEAALLYESGSYKKLDYTILVCAPEDVRIARVIQRDKVSREEVLSRMRKQMPEGEKIAFADFIIYNDGRPLLPQVLTIHQSLIQL